MGYQLRLYVILGKYSRYKSLGLDTWILISIVINFSKMSLGPNEALDYAKLNYL